MLYDRRKVVAKVASATVMALFYIYNDQYLMHDDKSIMKGI